MAVAPPQPLGSLLSSGAKFLLILITSSKFISQVLGFVASVKEVTFLGLYKVCQGPFHTLFVYTTTDYKHFIYAKRKFAFCRSDKTLQLKAAQEESGFFSVPDPITVHNEGQSGGNLEAGTEADTIDGYCLLACSWWLAWPAFLNSWPRCDTTHSELCLLPTSSVPRETRLDSGLCLLPTSQLN